jgi:hypothetical protein
MVRTQQIMAFLDRLEAQREPPHIALLRSVGDDTATPVQLDRPAGKTCSREGCARLLGTHKSYCDDCFATYMREYRNRDSDIIYRDSVRLVTRQMIDAGHIEREPCEICGAFGESHHEDLQQAL